PHCLARDRLRLWLPVSSRALAPETHSSLPLTNDDLERILSVIGARWEIRTREAYGFGLLVLHGWCDSRRVAEPLRCPISTTLLLALISSCAGSYSGTAIRNIVYGICAWHVLHGQHWLVVWNKVETALEGASKLSPTSSRRPERAPWTPEIMVRIRETLDLNSSLDSAVFACITTVFWSAARLGEFTLNSLSAFDHQKHITVANVKRSVGPGGEPVMAFYLPHTKCATNGEEVYWARQGGPADPGWAYMNHLQINTPRPDKFLFSWTHSSGKRRVLTKTELLRRINRSVCKQQVCLQCMVMAFALGLCWNTSCAASLSTLLNHWAAGPAIHLYFI
ncbi:hypothetical protein B0H34DRAFT_813930, partial [Crassisporium funariophilum]